MFVGCFATSHERRRSAGRGPSPAELADLWNGPDVHASVRAEAVAARPAPSGRDRPRDAGRAAELQEAGDEPLLADLCRDCPHLLPAAERRDVPGYRLLARLGKGGFGEVF